MDSRGSEHGPFCRLQPHLFKMKSMTRKQLSTTDRLCESLRRMSRFVLRLIGSMLCVGLMW